MRTVRTPITPILLTGACLVPMLSAGCGPDDAIELPRALPGPSPVEYPIELWDLDLEGETTIMVLVNEAGTVDSVFVDRSSGFEDFDSAAVRGGRAMRFDPGRRGEERVSVWVRVPVRFQKNDRRDGGADDTPGS